MRTKGASIFQFLGLDTNGDLGDFTFFTDQRNEPVYFLKTWPKDPATYHQTIKRQRFSHIGNRWRSLDDATRSLWETLSHRANLQITGYNLFVVYMLGTGTRYVQTLQSKTGLDVITPTGAPLPFPL